MPAMGYGEEQVRELEETIRRTPAEAVVIGTPVDLRRLLRLDRPAVRVTYELEERTRPGLREVVDAWLARGGRAPARATSAPAGS